MCNRYQWTSPADRVREMLGVDQIENLAGNLEPSDIYPDQLAPIVTQEDGGHVLRRARWGMPSPPQYHTKSGIDRGITNIRNTGSLHWRRWLDRAHRCLVPVDRFAEPRPGKGAGNAWFAPASGEPAFFAGLWVAKWASIRKLKDGETVDDLFGFLTCPPNGMVGPIHPKAMPVILTDREDMRAWLEAPWEEARELQRPLPDDELVLIDYEDG